MTDKRLRMPPEMVKLDVQWLLPDAQTAMNTFYVVRRDCTALGSPVDFDDASANDQAAHLASALHTWLAPLLATAVSVTGVDWTWNESISTPVLHEGTNTDSPIPFAGGNTGHVAENGLAVTMRMQTGLGGRGNHGRVFLPGVNDGLFDAGSPNKLKAGSVADFSSAFGSLLPAINNNDCVIDVGQQYQLVVASFIFHNALRAVASYHNVTKLNLKDPFFDFQRRRAPAHNRHH